MATKGTVGLYHDSVEINGILFDKLVRAGPVGTRSVGVAAAAAGSGSRGGSWGSTVWESRERFNVNVIGVCGDGCAPRGRRHLWGEGSEDGEGGGRKWLKTYPSNTDCGRGKRAGMGLPKRIGALDGNWEKG